MLYDTHAHVNFEAYQENYKELIENTLKQGVWLNNVGTNRKTSEEAVKIANEFDEGIYATVGIHPSHSVEPGRDDIEGHTSELEVFDYEFYSALAKDPKVVGIGECGLDYYRLPDNMDSKQAKLMQADAFRQHIKLSKEAN